MSRIAWSDDDGTYCDSCGRLYVYVSVGVVSSLQPPLDALPLALRMPVLTMVLTLLYRTVRLVRLPNSKVTQWLGREIRLRNS